MTDKHVQDGKTDLSSAPRLELQARLEKAMKEREMSIDGLKVVIQSMSETARRFVRGLAVPSNGILKLMSDEFGWDFEEIKAVAIRDRERIKHGDLVDVAHNIDPASYKFVLAWPVLTKQQRKALTTELGRYLQANKVGKLNNTAKYDAD